MTTGPFDTRYQIPDITLGDTFNEWRTTTNDSIIDKLNRMKVYTAVSGDGINVVGTGGSDYTGQWQIQHSGVVEVGVTFNGPVTFNGAYTTINAQEFQVDDYTIMLGATGHQGTGGAGASDTIIGNQGGGGLQIIRADGPTANLVWKGTHVGWSGGASGMWWVEGPNVGLTSNAWIYPQDNVLRIQTNSIGGSGEGIQISRGPEGAAYGLTAPDMIIQSASTAGKFYDLVNIKSYGISTAHFNVVNGANRMRIYAKGHPFKVGFAVRFDSNTGWTMAQGNNEEAAEALGIVSTVVGSNTADICMHGEVIGDFRDATVDGATLTPGTAYFLSAVTAGQLSTAVPNDSGQINKPMILALDNMAALGPSGDRALVLNYRGNLIPDEADDVTVQQSNKILIDQVNDFVVGDLIRFEKDEYYGWSGTAGTTGGQFYSNGVWRRGQANSDHDAEVVGQVVQTNVASDPNKFYMAINGKVSVADNSSLTPLTPGRVYFLSANSAPDGRGGLGNSADGLVLDTPLTEGHVKKPWAVATTTTEMIIVNYKGSVVGSDCGGGGGGGGGITVDQPPIGSIIAWTGTADTPPNAWLFCEGQTLTESDYPELFNVVDRRYGGITADGTFMIPDLRNRVIAGANRELDGNPLIADESTTTDVIHSSLIRLAETGGLSKHLMTGAESGIPAHGHALNETLGVHRKDDIDYHWTCSSYGAASCNSCSNPFSYGDGVPVPLIHNDFGNHEGTCKLNDQYGWHDGSFYMNHDFTIGDATATNASNNHSIMQPYVGLYWIIKAKSDPQIADGGGGGSDCVLDVGRNLLINGNFDIWQRLGGFTFGVGAGKSADYFATGSVDGNRGGPYRTTNETGALPTKFLADRWGLFNRGDWNAAATNGGVSRHAFDFGSDAGVLRRDQSKEAKYFLRLTGTGAAGLSAPGIEQRIEGVDSVYNEKATVTFWAKRNSGSAIDLKGVQVRLRGFATGTGDYGATNDSVDIGSVRPNFEMYSRLKSPLMELNTSWTKYTYTFDVPDITGVCAGAINSVTHATDWPGASVIPGQGFVALQFQPISGETHTDESTPNDKSERWLGEFDIAQVQFERGSRATQYDKRTHAEELRMCRRYYQKSYEPDTVPQMATQTGHEVRTDRGIGADGGILHGQTIFNEPMRCPPRVDIYSIRGTEKKICGPDESSDWYSPANEFGDMRVYRFLHDTNADDLSEAEKLKNVSIAGFSQVENTDGPASEHHLANSIHLGQWAFHYTADAEI